MCVDVQPPKGLFPASTELGLNLNLKSGGFACCFNNRCGSHPAPLSSNTPRRVGAHHAGFCLRGSGPPSLVDVPPDVDDGDTDPWTLTLYVPKAWSCCRPGPSGGTVTGLHQTRPAIPTAGWGAGEVAVVICVNTTTAWLPARSATRCHVRQEVWGAGAGPPRSTAGICHCGLECALCGG